MIEVRQISTKSNDFKNIKRVLLLTAYSLVSCLLIFFWVLLHKWRDS